MLLLIAKSKNQMALGLPSKNVLIVRIIYIQKNIRKKRFIKNVLYKNINENQKYIFL